MLNILVVQDNDSVVSKILLNLYLIMCNVKFISNTYVTRNIRLSATYTYVTRKKVNETNAMCWGFFSCF